MVIDLSKALPPMFLQFVSDYYPDDYMEPYLFSFTEKWAKLDLFLRGSLAVSG